MSGLIMVAMLLAPTIPAGAGSANLVVARAQLSDAQATLDDLTPPAARLYRLFASTRLRVKADRAHLQVGHRRYLAIKRAVRHYRLGNVTEREFALALDMLEHEVVKDVLEHQNALIYDTIHRVGHTLGPLVQRLRRSGRLDVWNELWPATPASGSGLASCPVQGPHSFFDTFGAPRSGGRTHQGNDIFAAQWTPVVAPLDGYVTLRENTLGGQALLEYSSEATTYYAHLVEYGALGSVTTGTVIGYVGNTGNAQGFPYHLHFEYRPGDGDAVDPYPYLHEVC